MEHDFPRAILGHFQTCLNDILLVSDMQCLCLGNQMTNEAPLHHYGVPTIFQVFSVKTVTVHSKQTDESCGPDSSKARFFWGKRDRPLCAQPPGTLMVGPCEPDLVKAIYITPPSTVIGSYAPEPRDRLSLSFSRPYISPCQISALCFENRGWP